MAKRLPDFFCQMRREGCQQQREIFGQRFGDSRQLAEFVIQLDQLRDGGV